MQKFYNYLITISLIIQIMANRVNRYKTLYERMVRPDNGAVFPRHVFKRAANLHASVYDRVGDR